MNYERDTFIALHCCRINDDEIDPDLQKINFIIIIKIV